MTTSPLLLGASLLAAGLVGGATAHLFMPAPVAQASGGVGISPTGPSNLADQLESLLTTTEAIQRRLTMLESAPSAGARVAIAENGQAAPLPADPQILAAVEAYMAKSTTDQGTVRDLVANTLTNIRTQEDAQRDQDRADARVTALQARVDRLTEDLGLYSDQATKMYTALNDEQVKRDELRNSMRDGTGDFATIREDMRGLRDETALELEQFLTAEQLEAYNESNTGGGRGGFGGNGGGPGGGGSGGGQ